LQSATECKLPSTEKAKPALFILLQILSTFAGLIGLFRQIVFGFPLAKSSENIELPMSLAV